jgi:PPOX class probable F420-dependent enzyme
MGVPLSEEIRSLIRGANFAYLATLMADGSPQVAAVWVDLEGDRILVSTGETSLKARNTRRDPRVGLSTRRWRTRTWRRRSAVVSWSGGRTPSSG